MGSWVKIFLIREKSEMLERGIGVCGSQTAGGGEGLEEEGLPGPHSCTPVCVCVTHTHLSHLSLTSGPLCRAVSLCWASDLEPRVPGKGTGGVQAWVLVGARCSLTPVWLHL